MNDRSARTAMLERLIRVRRVRARLAMAALGRTQARHLAEAALHRRVATLLADAGTVAGKKAAAAAAARATAAARLGTLADDVGRRLAATAHEQQQLAQALARAQAAVDAAVARRVDREAKG